MIKELYDAAEKVRNCPLRKDKNELRNMLDKYKMIVDLAIDNLLDSDDLEMACLSASAYYMESPNQINKINCRNLFEQYFNRFGNEKLGMVDSFLLFLSICYDYEDMISIINGFLEINKHRLEALKWIYSFKELVGVGWYGINEYIELMEELKNSGYHDDGNLQKEIDFYTKRVNSGN